MPFGKRGGVGNGTQASMKSKNIRIKIIRGEIFTFWKGLLFRIISYDLFVNARLGR